MGKGLIKSHQIAEEILSIDGCWDMESLTSLGIGPQIGCQCFSGWPYIHACVGMTK